MYFSCNVLKIISIKKVENLVLVETPVENDF